jgi:hypothetical protein
MRDTPFWNREPRAASAQIEIRSVEIAGGQVFEHDSIITLQRGICINGRDKICDQVHQHRRVRGVLLNPALGIVARRAARDQEGPVRGFEQKHLARDLDQQALEQRLFGQ